MRNIVFSALLTLSPAMIAVAHAEDVEKPAATTPCQGDFEPGYTCTRDAKGTETTKSPDGTVSTHRPNGDVTVTHPNGGKEMWNNNKMPMTEEGRKSGCSMISLAHTPPSGSAPPSLLLLLCATIALVARRRST